MALVDIAGLFEDILSNKVLKETLFACDRSVDRR